MALSDFKLNFTKDWTNERDFPVFESSEAKVRANLQYLFNEIRTAFNDLLDGLRANIIPFSSTPEIPASSVQGAIEAVQQQIAETVQGAVPDNSIESTKLKTKNENYLGITSDKIKAGAVITELLGDACVTGPKISDGAVSNEKVADGTLTRDKIAEHAFDDKADLVDGRIPASQLAKGVMTQGLVSAYTLLASDAGKVICCNNTAAGSIIVPSNTAVEFQVGTEIVILQQASGVVTVSAAEGVSLRFANGSTLRTLGINTGIRLVKVSTNAWAAIHLDALEDGQVKSNKLASSAVTADKIGVGAVTADKIGAGAVSTDYTATLAAASWSGSTAPFSYACSISGILATDKPLVDLVASGTWATAEKQIEAWGYVYRCVTSANTLTFYATEKPTVALPIQVKCVRK